MPNPDHALLLVEGLGGVRKAKPVFADPDLTALSGSVPRSAEADAMEELVTDSKAGVVKALGELKVLVAAGIADPQVREKAAYALSKGLLEEHASRQFALEKSVSVQEMTNSEREYADMVSMVRQSQARVTGPGTFASSDPRSQVASVADSSYQVQSPGTPNPATHGVPPGLFLDQGAGPEPAAQPGAIEDELVAKVAAARNETERALASEALTFERLRKAAMSPIDSLLSMLAGQRDPALQADVDLLSERNQINTKIQGLEKSIEADGPRNRNHGPHPLSGELTHLRLRKAHLEGGR
jgi:hypothetical protein